jgi:cytochrome c biogenesis protein ResB
MRQAHPFMVLLIEFNSLLGLDHVYTTWWFLSLIITLGICLISCTVTRHFFCKLERVFFLKEILLGLPFLLK